MRADAVHLVEDALALPIERPLDTQNRELIRDDAEIPARHVRPAAVVAHGEELGRRHLLVPFAEGT